MTDPFNPGNVAPTQREKFVRQAFGTEPVSLPELPKIPENLKNMMGGRHKEDWENFEKNIHAFFKEQVFGRTL